MTRRITQQNNYSCFACCLAMATGKTLKYVYKELGHDGSEILQDSQHPDKRRGFRLQESAIYLAKHNLLMGAMFLFDKTRVNPKHAVTGYIAVNLNLRAPALISVVSEVLPPPCQHMIYWTGEEVLDPRPDAPRNRPLEEYRILEWWPLIELVD